MNAQTTTTVEAPSLTHQLSTGGRSKHLSVIPAPGSVEAILKRHLLLFDFAPNVSEGAPNVVDSLRLYLQLVAYIRGGRGAQGPVFRVNGLTRYGCLSLSRVCTQTTESRVEKAPLNFTLKMQTDPSVYVGGKIMGT